MMKIKINLVEMNLYEIILLDKIKLKKKMKVGKCNENIEFQKLPSLSSAENSLSGKATSIVMYKFP